MDDTPAHIKQLQLAIWLAKPPEEWLRLTLEDNDALFALWAESFIKSRLAGMFFSIR